MTEDFEETKIDINEISLYPEMNKNIVDILMIRDNDIVSVYAAKLIKYYQDKEEGLCHKKHNI